MESAPVHSPEALVPLEQTDPSLMAWADTTLQTITYSEIIELNMSMNTVNETVRKVQKK